LEISDAGLAYKAGGTVPRYEAYYIFLILHILSAIPYIFPLFFLIGFSVPKILNGQQGNPITGQAFPGTFHLLVPLGSMSTRK
jgi:hypothetical protein